MTLMRCDTESCGLDEVVEAKKHASSGTEVVAKVLNMRCWLSQNKKANYVTATRSLEKACERVVKESQ